MSYRFVVTLAGATLFVCACVCVCGGGGGFLLLIRQRMISGAKWGQKKEEGKKKIKYLSVENYLKLPKGLDFF